MASNVASGAYGVWYYKSTLSNADLLNVRAGKIPATTAASWLRIFTSMTDGATLSRDGSTIELGTQEEGITGIVISDVDRWTLEIPIADISVDNAKLFMMLNPAYASSSGTGVRIDGSYIGTDLMDYGYLMVIANKAYASTNTDTPPITDPNAFVFVNGVANNRAASISYDPASQQMYNVSLGFTAIASSSGESCFGYHGTLTTTS